MNRIGALVTAPPHPESSQREDTAGSQLSMGRKWALSKHRPRTVRSKCLLFRSRPAFGFWVAAPMDRAAWGFISLSDFRVLSHQLVPCGDASPGIAGQSALGSQPAAPTQPPCEEPVQVASPPPPRPRVSGGASAAPPAQVCSHDETWCRPCAPGQVGSTGDAGLSVAAAQAPGPHLPVMSPTCRKRSQSTCSAPGAAPLLGKCRRRAVASALAGRADNGCCTRRVITG